MHTELSPDRIYVTVDILILAVEEGKLRLMLSRRTAPPYAGCWALPGRFVGLDESAESAAEGLLKEMLPRTNAFLEQLYTFTDVGRDPRGRVISTAYLAIVPTGRIGRPVERGETPLVPFVAGLNEKGLWLKAEEGPALPSGELAFDHGRIIETGIQRLRGKVDYTDIAFRFLGTTESFSLSELQTVFQAILDKDVDSSNFRRFIRARYEDTGRMEPTRMEQKGGRGRPAALYRLIK